MSVAEAERVMGEVFTRRWVVESILDLVGYTSDQNLTRLRLIEPSVGCQGTVGTAQWRT